MKLPGWTGAMKPDEFRGAIEDTLRQNTPRGRGAVPVGAVTALKKLVADTKGASGWIADSQDTHGVRRKLADALAHMIENSDLATVNREAFNETAQWLFELAPERITRMLVEGDISRAHALVDMLNQGKEATRQSPAGSSWGGTIQVGAGMTPSTTPQR